ncbi:MAG: glycosyltransferase family 4 protein [Micrococcales bacterium]|nr:glycosyltransferase family 4 protein [Micrococcales bacterium]
MRILVHTHRLETGGSQRNAIDLAAGVRDLGHEVVVYGAPGPSLDLVHERGLEFVAAPDTGDGPTPEGMRALRSLVESERFDLVHSYEWSQALTAFRALSTLRVPMVFTVLSMAVPRWMPRSVPLVVGTRQLQQSTAAWWRAPVHVVEPPVDVASDEEPSDVATFATEHGLEDHADVLDLVVVSRLVEDGKVEGIRLAIDVVGDLAATSPVRLVVVGDGESVPDLARRAEAVNAAVGREAVVLTGAMTDPRPAYQLADVVLGMGGSALRGMASSKPVVVLGVDGYSEVVDPSTYEQYLWWGFLGVGHEGDAARHLRGLVEGLADPARRAELGTWGHERVTEDFALTALSRRLEDVYLESRDKDMVGRWGAAVESARSSSRRALSDALPPSLKQALSGGRSGRPSAVSGGAGRPPAP